MYNLYLKGLSTDNQELNQIRTLFKENGLEFTNVLMTMLVYLSIPK